MSLDLSQKEYSQDLASVEPVFKIIFQGQVNASMELLFHFVVDHPFYEAIEPLIRVMELACCFQSIKILTIREEELRNLSKKRAEIAHVGSISESLCTLKKSY